MQGFIKQETGLAEIGRAKLKTYESIQDVCDAIARGELQPGDAFGTVAAHGVTEDILETVNCLVSITPGAASPANMLVTQDMLDNTGGDIDALASRVCNVETTLATDTIKCNTFNALAARVGVNETNISNKVDCSDYSAYTTCADQRLGEAESNINDINDCTACLQTQIDDLNTDLGNYTTCTDFNAYCTCADACLASLCDCKADCSSLQEVCDDVSDHATRINALESCPGLNCVGKVTALYNQANGNTISPNADGVVSVQLPVFTLSGTTLTINF